MSDFERELAAGQKAWDEKRYFEAWLHLSAAMEIADPDTDMDVHAAVISNLKPWVRDAYNRSLSKRKDKKKRKAREERERREEIERRARQRHGKYYRNTGTPPVGRASLTAHLSSGLGKLRVSSNHSDPDDSAHEGV